MRGALMRPSLIRDRVWLNDGRLSALVVYPAASVLHQEPLLSRLLTLQVRRVPITLLRVSAYPPDSHSDCQSLELDRKWMSSTWRALAWYWMFWSTARGVSVSCQNSVSGPAEMPFSVALLDKWYMVCCCIYSAQRMPCCDR